MVVSPNSSIVATPKRLPANERRQQLLDVAMRLFAQNGFKATTMDDIAEHAGVTKPLLYQHFASKRALYLELVESVAQRMLNAVEEATSQARTPREQVEGGFTAYFELVLAHAEAFQLLLGSDSPGDPGMSRMLRHVEDVLAAAVSDLIDAGLDDDHRRMLAYAVVGMAEGASRYVLASSRNRVPSMALDGRPPAPGRRPGAPAAGTDPSVQPGIGVDDSAMARRMAIRLADLAWAGLRSVHRD
ncbi:MAG: TetR/AcrR family transcriptional regulator [Actinomycetota bacterium]|jgi:AcrR family transcriptional regulator|nr:TetR/AcrR family transcriptional regulator [Actinomycetota bacterium]